MKKENETFSNLMNSFRYRYDTSSVFSDFLTMSLCAFSQNPLTGASHDEDLYLQTIAGYKNDEIRHVFPKLMASLIVEMEDKLDDGSGNDVLGNYYELNLGKNGKGQFFTPWPICKFIAQCNGPKVTDDEQALRVLDPTCGSGRMLIAGAKTYGPHHNYYGIDIDHTCVKMTAINLFLNGIFHAEVMCADALMRSDFQVSYRTSLLPFGVFRITEREKSPLWNIYNNSFEDKVVVKNTPKFTGSNEAGQPASQLKLF